MIDKGLKIGSGFDWLSPAFAFFKDLLSGKTVTYFVASGLEGGPYILADYIRNSVNIEVWGVMLTRDGEYSTFTIKKKDVDKLNTFFERQNIPYEYR